MPSYRLLEKRAFTPPRPVEVERDGSWWPGLQSAWRLRDDGRWVAYVVYTTQNQYGTFTLRHFVLPERVRVPQS